MVGIALALLVASAGPALGGPGSERSINPCAGVVCAPPTACQGPGACEPTTGRCIYPAKPDGTACDDGNACTLADTCEAGACTGSATPAAVLDGQGEAPFGGAPGGSGAITLKLNAVSGTVCYDLAWRGIGVPTAARVLGGDPGHPSSEEITLFRGQPNHAGCVRADPRLISIVRAHPAKYYARIDTAEIPSGAISGPLGRTMACPPADACHLKGACDPAAATCAPRVVVDGTPCGEGDAAATGAMCTAGVCKVAPNVGPSTLRGGTPQGTTSVPDVRNSYLLPNKGDIWVLNVFAYCTVPTGHPSCSNFLPGGAPAGANTWFDTGPSPVLHGVITNHFAQASFDQYMVYGDSWATVVTMPCTGSATLDASTVTNTVNSGPWATVNNLPKSLFDRWAPTSIGMPKTHGANGKLDAVTVIWANHPEFGGCYGNGYGMQQMGGGADATASFNEFPTGYSFFLAEYFHALFGHNNFHNGGGAGQHTFLVFPHTHSLAGQAYATSKIANAETRVRMGWTPPTRSDPIMSGDASCSFDVPSDIDITTHPSGGTFCLRDYNLMGDALRIKLPHLDWNQSKPGQNPLAKNQYLIVENHLLEQSLLPPRYTINADIIGSPANPATPGYVSCMDPSQPGLFAYIQVGKDTQAGTTNDLYGFTPSQPNGLGSWTFSLDPKGNYDYVYRADLLQPGSWAINCNWNNANIPKQRWHARTVPNAFTGLSDLGWVADSNNDGTLYSGDNNVSLGLSEVSRDGTVWNNWNEHGGSGTSYRLGFKTRIGLDTNPAATPLYTYTINPFPPVLQSYENRRIYLNGLSVQIISQNPVGAGSGALNGATIVQVRWDDTQVNHDVRWAGDISLQKDPDDPYGRPSTIDLSSGRTIDLDQGLSPTQHLGTQSGGTWLFARPTILTLEAGTTTTVRDKAKIAVRHGSTLYVKSGANLVIQGAGGVIVNGDAFLCVESGANVVLQDPNSQLLLNAGATAGLNPALGQSTTCQALSAVTAAGSGTVVASRACVPAPAGTRAYWPLDGTSGTEIDVVHSNALSTQGNPPACPGIVNDALCLDGLATYASAPDNAFLNVGSGNFSIDGWIRTLDSQGMVTILDKRVDTPFRGYHLFLDNGRLGFQMADGVGTQFTNYASNTFVADGLWHHIAVTVARNSTTGGTFYVDCTPISQRFNPRSGNLTNSSPLVLGRRSVSPYDGYLSAALDEFRIYTRALAPGQIQNLCTSVGVGVCAAPICGNGVCEIGEDCCSCPEDCGGGVSCC